MNGFVREAGAVAYNLLVDQERGPEAKAAEATVPVPATPAPPVVIEAAVPTA